MEGDLERAAKGGREWKKIATDGDKLSDVACTPRGPRGEKKNLSTLSTIVCRPRIYDGTEQTRHDSTKQNSCVQSKVNVKGNL